MLAVVYFTRYFKHYLLGKRVTPRTDHGSLTWLKNFKEPDGQILVHRWMQQLCQFHMKILVVHRPGKRTWECRCNVKVNRITKGSM